MAKVRLFLISSFKSAKVNSSQFIAKLLLLQHLCDYIILVIYFSIEYMVYFIGRRNGLMDKVMIVDDDVRMLRLLKMYLEGLYDVYPVRGGREALDFLESQTPDVILLDYLMPGLDGVHTLELIRQREQTADTPVIFLTGVTEKDKIQECMEYRPYGYLVKPAAREELISMINRALNEAQL